MDWWIKWESTCTSSIMNIRELKTKKSTKTENKSTELGDIDNSSLTEKIVSNDCVQLKANLRYGIDFEIVPELLWKFLLKYYRCIGPGICRKVIYKKKINKPELDLYPVC